MPVTGIEDRRVVGWLFRTTKIKRSAVDGITAISTDHAIQMGNNRRGTLFKIIAKKISHPFVLIKKIVAVQGKAVCIISFMYSIFSDCPNTLYPMLHATKL